MTTENRKAITILVADDDLDDCLLIKAALTEARLTNDLRFVHDGEALLDYLYRRGSYTERINSPRPGLILLDLNMPKKNGREALQEIKSVPYLRQIPIVVLTTSQVEEEIYRSYDLGASSFITKPVSFGALVEVMKALGRYWFELVELPLTERS
jgi:CheY-like chemotaxis protein